LTTTIFDGGTALGTGTSPYQTPVLAAGSHSFTVRNCEAGGACSVDSNATVAVVVPAAPAAVSDLTSVIVP
jgi:hypothetical protein